MTESMYVEPEPHRTREVVDGPSAAPIGNVAWSPMQPNSTALEYERHLVSSNRASLGPLLILA